ncbi:hypothetical protein ACPPVO_23730 [Dactylosporangium sp. McL0621]|uniref:hypothetical protein n=1 Tax=Dactylosporangium sp. McL0621 TaxID=3415678 RepID=UPI003CEFDB3B
MTRRTSIDIPSTLAKHLHERVYPLDELDVRLPAGLVTLLDAVHARPALQTMQLMGEGGRVKRIRGLRALDVEMLVQQRPQLVGGSRLR